jgi:hypothetical protein
MNRSLKQKLAARAAVVVILVGGAVAAVSATGQDPSYTRAAARHGAHRVARPGLAPVAGYLGVTVSQLEGDLASGKTLAEVADARNGKSAAGLIEAIVAARRHKLTAAAATLSKRVTAAVNRRGGLGPRRNGGARRPGWRRLFAAPTRLGFVAASYLGMPAAQLQGDLRSGETLAQVAKARSGRSEAGLIEALVATRRARLAAAVASGNLPAARAGAIRSKLSRRVTRLVNASQLSAPQLSAPQARHRRAQSKG